MSLRSDIEEVLGNENRSAFLATFIFNLTISARAAYVEAGNTPEAAIVGMKCCNELLHVAGSQLMASHGVAAGYPDDAFLDSLASKAQVFGGCEGGLRWALERALESTRMDADRIKDATDPPLP